jgi:hypothetical protein
MTKKPVAGDLVFQQAVELMPLRPRHGADGAARRAPTLSACRSRGAHETTQRALASSEIL